MTMPTPITLTYDGKTLSLRDWAAYLATVMDDPPAVTVLYTRHYQRWPVARILTTPLLRRDLAHSNFAAAVARYLASQEERPACRT